MSERNYTIPNSDDISSSDIEPKANLKGFDFSNANLKGADLTNANLTNTDLSDANLRNAVLYEANLTNAKLKRADISEATLSKADLHEASLTGANLKKADLRWATLTNAALPKSNLTSATLRSANLHDAVLDGADLVDANLKGANLVETAFWDADLTGANLYNADLTDAYLRGTDLTDAGLGHADLTNVDLRRGDLTDADFHEATLHQVDAEKATFCGANLKEATLNSADCEGTNFNRATLNRATLENADLTGANFSRAYLYQTRLDGAQISEETQFHPDGDVGDYSTPNGCRYDSHIPPETSAASIEEQSIDDMDKNAEETRARRARSTYSRLEDLARENGFPDLKSEMFIRRQDARRELLFAQGQQLRGYFAQLQKSLFNYGESFRRIIGISVIVIILGWISYLTFGIVETNDGGVINLQEISNDPMLIYDTLLQSLLVFSSGNRVLETTGRIGEGFVVLQSMIGPFLIALLIFVLGRRAAR